MSYSHPVNSAAEQGLQVFEHTIRASRLWHADDPGRRTVAKRRLARPYSKCKPLEGRTTVTLASQFGGRTLPIRGPADSGAMPRQRCGWAMWQDVVTATRRCGAVLELRDARACPILACDSAWSSWASRPWRQADRTRETHCPPTRVGPHACDISERGDRAGSRALPQSEPPRAGLV